MYSMRSFINKAFAFIALLSALPAFNSPQITDVFIDPYTNGLLYTLYSEEKVDIDNVSSWMSPHGWYYITVNGATFSLEIPGKIPAVDQIKDIVIKNNHESGQIAFLLSRPVNDIQILKSEISNAFQVSAVYKTNKAIKQRLGEVVNDEKNKGHKFEQRSRPLARKKLQDSIDRSPSVSYLNQGFSPDSLNNAVDRMIDDLVFDLADINAFKKNKTIQNETEFIRMNEGIENRSNEPNVMNDFADIGNLAINDAAALYIRELFTPNKSWYEDDFFQPKASPLNKGQLKITSTIDDITIFIDDEYVGLTPISENIELTVGSHKVWCIPPVPINNSRWYENPISENVIGDVIHNVFIESNEVTIVDFDLYILNTSPNYKEKSIYQDSLGTIFGLGETKQNTNKEMKRFLNKRIKSLKSSSSKKSSSIKINLTKDKKYKEILNGPPPIVTSELNKEKNIQLVPKLIQSDSEGSIKNDENNYSDDPSIKDGLNDESKESGPDSSKNLFSRLLSTFRKNDDTSRSNKKNSISDLFGDTISEKRNNKTDNSSRSKNINSKDKKNSEPKSVKELFSNSDTKKDIDKVNDLGSESKRNLQEKEISKPKKRSSLKNIFSSNKGKTKNIQINTVKPRINRRVSKLDVTRIVNAEYVNPKKRLPDNIDYSFPSSNHRVYCFTVIKNLNDPVNVSHYWYKNGNFMARVPMEVGYSSSWRCWSYITLRDGFEGDWKVVVRGPNNEELEEISFTIFPNRDLAKQKR